MIAAGPMIPLDGKTAYADGLYVLYRDRWFWAEMGKPWPEKVVVGVQSGEDIPEGFVECPEHINFVAQREVNADELSAMCDVGTYCTWKNRVWRLDKLDRVANVAILKIALSLKGDYSETEPFPRNGEFAHVPGVEYWDPEWIAVEVRPKEMARVMMLVAPFDIFAPPRSRTGKRIQVWVDSAPSSPWLPAEDALAIVRERFAGEDMGSYPADNLQADRLRDGWRVWAPPPVSDDPLDVRMGWAVWYVADDGVVWRSSTSTDFGSAATELTNQLFHRLQATHQSSNAG